MMKAEVKRGLGRGLDALFGDEEEEVSLSKAGDQQKATSYNELTAANVAPSAPAAAKPTGRVELDIDQLQPGEFQPRLTFNEEALATLAESIKTHGLLQPILVRELKDKKGRYEIIAGERRWRASQRANLHKVPVIISTLDDTQALEVALVENLQREDLNPVDEAMGYHRLMTEFDHTQEKIAEVLGKSRSHIANMVRLLNLPEKVQGYLREGKLSVGHARTLITATNVDRLADEIVNKNLNVRQTEAMVAVKGKPLNKKLTDTNKTADAIALQNDLSNMLGMRVAIETNSDGKSGSVRVKFKTLDQLDEIIRRLSKMPTVHLAD